MLTYADVCWRMQKEEGEVGQCESSSVEKVEEVRVISAKPEREEEEEEGGGGGGKDGGSGREAKREQRKPESHTLNRGDQNVEEAVKYDVDERDAAEGDAEVGGDSMLNEVLHVGDREEVERMLGGDSEGIERG